MPETLQTPCYLVSDAHLGAAPADTERTLLAFLEQVRTDGKSLVINGDLFDFWFEWGQVIPRTGFRTLAALAALREAGVAIVWVAGNHDCWGGDVLQHDVGVTYSLIPWRGMIGPWNALIEHGDGSRELEDAPYRRLRTVLRHPLCSWAFRHLLHPDWAVAIAKGSSHTSRSMRPADGGSGLQRVALAQLAAEPALDLLVFGHSHAQSLDRASGGGVYGNPGAWLDGPTALRIDADVVELVSYDEAGTRTLKREHRRRS